MVERFVLRRLVGAELAQVLVTLGLSFMVADVCLMLWGGDPIAVETPPRRCAARPRCSGWRSRPTGWRSS